MKKKTPALVITCEHASNAVPRFLAQRIAATGEAGIPEEYLYSHRGYDIGAYGVYLRLIRKLHPDFYIAGKYSRLVIDLNRSENHPGLLSKYTQDFKDPTRKRILEIWQRHHDAVESFVAKTIANSQGQEIDAPRVIHLGIHSFTPILNNVESCTTPLAHGKRKSRPPSSKKSRRAPQNSGSGGTTPTSASRTGSPHRSARSSAPPMSASR